MSGSHQAGAEEKLPGTAMAGETLIYPQTATGKTGIQSPISDETNHPGPARTAAAATGAEEGQPLLDEALGFCELAQSFWEKGELENALEALDNAYALILDADAKEDAKLIQQKEDLRYLISKRILEIYASRNIVVNGKHDEIPMEMNIHVKNELKRFTGNEKQFITQSYVRSGYYRPYMVEALRKAGLPEELSWLPLIESGFKVKALSRARALGLWQFIPSTGYKFGLKRDRYVDERMDFVKATHAAIAYLKELHNIFGDWATVLAAYNCGEGRVLRVIRTQKVNYLDNFWDLYQRLPRETARYVPRFFATLHIVKNLEKYGFDHLTPEAPLDFDAVTINRQVRLTDVSKTTGIELKALKALNPELRYDLLPPESYTLRVPKGDEQNLLAKVETIPVSRLPQRTYVYHRVRPGQTLSSIARRYRTSVGAIMRANNMRRSNFIRAGKRLKIPQRGYAFAKSNTPAKPGTAPSTGKHYVRKGDSLWNIANRYGTTVKKIQQLNHLSSSHLHIGQGLKIPGFKPEPLPDTSQLGTYSVRRGDSPYTIAQKHNMALERLLRINRLTPRSKIYPGQKLFIE
jgi:membrane-bound lytic murein transglycosylase D